MKIIVEKIYSEEDVYDFPERNWAIKLKKDEVLKAVLVHKKGDFIKEKLTVEKYCCNKMERAVKEDFIHIRHEFDGLTMDSGPGCFIEARGYDEDIDYTKIDFCPKCGEEIEVVQGETNNPKSNKEVEVSERRNGKDK